MKIPTARVERSVFFCDIFSVCGEAGRANVVCPCMGSGFYPLVLATKKVCYVGQDDKCRRKIAQGADYGFAGGFFRTVAKVCEKSDIYKSYEHTWDYVSEIHCADKRIFDAEVIIVA
mgnify:CR=1 FL=1